MPLISFDAFDRTLQTAQEYQKLKAYVSDIDIVKSRLESDGLQDSYMYRTLNDLTFSLRKDIRQHNELFELFFVLMRNALDFNEHFLYNEETHKLEGSYGQRMQNLLEWANITVHYSTEDVKSFQNHHTAYKTLKPYFNK